MVSALSLVQAIEQIPDGASVMIGGFMGVGSPHRMIAELVRQQRRHLTVIANDTARPGFGIGKLIDAKLVSRVIASHIGTNPETQRQMIAGELQVDLVPQGTMDDKELIARRVARELKSGTLVNLGIGLPTTVTRYLPPGMDVLFQAENGLIGMEAIPEPGMADDALTDAGGSFIGAVPGACSFDSCTSFGLIRGGHLDVTVLGGLQVDALGHLANWMIPGKMVPGMGGAMDLVTGAQRVIVAMTHTSKGQPKIVERCTLPLTSTRRVDLVVTELAVIEPTADGLVLRERAPGVNTEQVVAATGAKLTITGDVPEMQIMILETYSS
jgi:acetate CoA/acetoacetate CoA-transferase beta subunit